MIAVVGEAPSKFMHESGITTPLVLAAEEIAAYAGVGWPGEWSELFDVRNVLSFWPGRSLGSKGDRFPMSVAVAAADRLKPLLKGKVVLLGRRVERAWGLPEGRWFEWRGNVVVAPHPSKVSHWWNEGVNLAQAIEFWQEVAREARGGQDAIGTACGLAQPATGSGGP